MLKVFLTSSSHKQCVGLNVHNRYFQDHGLHFIQKRLNHSDVSIKKFMAEV